MATRMTTATSTETLPPFAISAAVWLRFGPEQREDAGPIAAHFCNQIGPTSDHLLQRPIPATSQYVIYWPGVLEIPWPQGVTAPEAVRLWKDHAIGLGEAFVPDPSTADEIRRALDEGRVRVEMRDKGEAFGCFVLPRP